MKTKMRRKKLSRLKERNISKHKTRSNRFKVIRKLKKLLHCQKNLNKSQRDLKEWNPISQDPKPSHGKY